MKTINLKKYFKWFLISTFILIIIVGSISGLVVVFNDTNNGYSYEQSANEITDYGLFANAVLKIIFGIIGGILTLLLLIIDPLVHVGLDALQNIIYILTAYPLLQNIIGFSYTQFLIWTSLIFIILFTIFLVLSIFQNTQDYNNRFNFLNLIKSILYFFLFPIIMMLILALGQCFADLIWGIGNIYEISIYDVIYDATLGNSSLNIDNGILSSASAQALKIILFLIAGITTIYYLALFTVSLFLRLFELIIFGITGIVIASSSHVYDGGERFRLWNSIMIQKIWIPLLSIMGYIVFLILIEPTINAIDGIPEEYFVLGLSYETKAILDIVFITMGTFLLKSLSSEWAFLIAGENGKSAFATQLKAINGGSGSVVMPLIAPIPGASTTFSLKDSLKNLVEREINPSDSNPNDNNFSISQNINNSITESNDYNEYQELSNESNNDEA